MSKNKQKLTPWFDGSVKPSRIGVYMQKDAFGARDGFQHWDGKLWRGWGHTISEARRLKDLEIDFKHQNDPWRGLAEDPNKSE